MKKRPLLNINTATAALAVLALGSLPVEAGFLPVVNYLVPGTDTSVAVGDFNRDGILDLAVPTYGLSNKVSILLGNADGTFQAAQSYSTGTEPRFVAVADFNGDGKPDVATANRLSGDDDVSILLGNGDGTLQAAVNYTAGFIPISLAVGDFNRDGRPDLAVANQGSNNVSILLGNGDGTFQPAQNYGAGTVTAPASVAVGDFNGDGNQDLAVANYVCGTSTVSILQGDGNGTFQPAGTSEVGEAPASVAVGDFNGDGKQDLAVANYCCCGPIGGDMSILLGNGNGTFQQAVSYGAGWRPSSVAVGDFNGDGAQDLAVTNTKSPDVSILLGNGNGTFQAPVNYVTESPNNSVAVGDFNRDGRPDLAVAHVNYIGVFLNSSSDTICAPRPAVNYTVGANPNFLAVGDFNRDGRQDLAVANVVSSTVSILLANGEGTFAPAVNYAAGEGPTSVAVGDFNQDGQQDLAIANESDPGTVSILIGGGGTFQTPVSYPTAGRYATSVAVGDFNRDGRQDLVLANLGNGGPENLGILLGNGNGTFQAAVTYGAGSLPYSAAVGDFNRDGIQDLAAANFGSGNVSILLGMGNGTFQSAMNYGAATNPLVVGLGDFNGDGNQDLAVPNGSGNVSILLGDGNGSFQAAVNYPAGTTPQSLAVGDFNGDGRQDLVVANANSHDISILRGSGNGTFQGPANYVAVPADSVPFAPVVGDFNRDGKQDLAVTITNGTVSILLNSCQLLTGDFDADGKTDILFRHQVSGQNLVWLMDGITRTASVNTSPSSLADTNWQIVGTHDFNGDASTDILFRHATTGKSLVWFMDGITQTSTAYTSPDGLADTNWRTVGTGDFSSPTDGKPDLLFRHAISGKNLVWFMNGITQTSTSYTNPDVLSDTNWRIVGGGDYSTPRDGKADVLWRHAVSGKNVVWFMDGITRTQGVFTYPDQLSDTNWQMVAVGDYSSPRDDKADIVFRHQVSGKNVIWLMDGITRTAGVFTNPDQLADTNWRIVGPK